MHCSVFGTSVEHKNGGERGIRTLETGLSPSTRLAGERLQPTRPSLHVFSCLCSFAKWRRRRDSNPRNPQRFNGFQDRLLQPLGHPSIAKVHSYPMQKKVYHRATSMSTSLLCGFRRNYYFQASHIRAQNLRYYHGTVCLLIVFENSRHGSPHCHPGTV